MGWHYRCVLFQPTEMASQLFFFSQLPDHVHNHLVQSLYQPISLGVIGHGPPSFDAKDLVQFLNYTTHEASTSITQAPGWDPKDRDVTFI